MFECEENASETARQGQQDCMRKVTELLCFLHGPCMWGSRERKKDQRQNLTWKIAQPLREMRKVSPKINAVAGTLRFRSLITAQTRSSHHDEYVQSHWRLLPWPKRCKQLLIMNYTPNFFSFFFKCSYAYVGGYSTSNPFHAYKRKRTNHVSLFRHLLIPLPPTSTDPSQPPKRLLSNFSVKSWTGWFFLDQVQIWSNVDHKDKRWRNTSCQFAKFNHFFSLPVRAADSRKKGHGKGNKRALGMSSLEWQQ